jgi:hypothetical protein
MEDATKWLSTCSNFSNISHHTLVSRKHTTYTHHYSTAHPNTLSARLRQQPLSSAAQGSQQTSHKKNWLHNNWIQESTQCQLPKCATSQPATASCWVLSATVTFFICRHHTYSHTAPTLAPHTTFPPQVVAAKYTDEKSQHTHHSLCLPENRQSPTRCQHTMIVPAQQNCSHAVETARCDCSITTSCIHTFQYQSTGHTCHNL